MRLLSLALRGLWWRRLTSSSLLVVAVFTTLVAAAGPLYAAAAGDAVLQRALRTAPVGEGGTGIAVTVTQTGVPSTDTLRGAVAGAFTGRAAQVYPSGVFELSSPGRGLVDGSDTATPLTLTDRQDFCAQVTVTAGTCVDATDPVGVVVDAESATTRGLRVGQPITLQGTRDDATGTATVLRVRGVVERRDPSAAYWFGETVTPTGGADPLQVWVPQAYFDGLEAEAGDNVVATADLPLAPSAVHVADVDTVVTDGLAGRSRLALPAAVVVVELLVLGWYLLHTLVGSATEARGSEIALVKLRGTRPRSTVVITLLEPTLLLVLAVPLGVLGAVLAVRGLAPSVLGPDAQIRSGWWPWVTAAAAAVGGLVAAAAGSLAVLRRPVLEQWRRTTRRPGRRAAVLETVVVALAVAGVVELRVSGALDSGGGSSVAVLAPVLIMVAGAIVASRAVAAVARLGFRATRGSGAVAVFVSVRQLARRPAGRRTFGVLTVAVALVVFAVSSAVVLAQNRHDRASVDVGASGVVHVIADPRNGERIAAADGGRGEMAAVFEGSTAVSVTTGVFDGPATASASPTLLVVDPATFARVGFWRSDFGSASLAELLTPLAAAAPTSPTVTGTRLELDVTGADVPDAVTLAADLTDAAGDPVTARFGTLTDGARRYTADVACAGGCELRRVYVGRPDDRIGPLVMSFIVNGVRVEGGTRTTPSPALADVRWSAMNPTPGLQPDPAETVTVTGAGVRVAVSISGRPGDGVPGFGAAAGAVDRQPGLVADGVVVGGAVRDIAVNSPAGGQFAVTPTGRTVVVPRAGDGEIVLARDWVRAASPAGYAALAPDEVWLAASAPADSVDRLRRAGLVVTGVERADERAEELSRQGPAFATALSVAGGVVAVLLAAAAAVLTLALLARRRIFELSAMRALGIGAPRLLASVVIEQGALVVAAALSGLGLGVAAVALTLPALPAYVDLPAYPRFLVDQPVGLLSGVVAAVAVLLVAAVTLGASLLVRSAAPARLREAEG